MTRRSLRQLVAECRYAALDIPIGSEWRHYKGDVYEITGFGINEQSNEVEVEYRPAYDLRTTDPGQIVLRRFGGGDLDRLTFHTPLSRWQDPVWVPASEGLSNEAVEVPRRVRIYRQEQWTDRI